jgi:hypothetical protein
VSHFRCAATSASLDEPLVGTASTVRAFLLVQQSGPWGEDALRDSRLPEAVSTGLQRLCTKANVRPLLIRRHGRDQPDGVRVFAAYADPHQPWLETGVVDDLDDLLELDLPALGRGFSVGLDPTEQPVFCVCTHGRHDVCCAELGRPLAAALSASYPEHTWECSHIGGDRFAGNLLQLPHGLYYGRANASSGPSIASATLDGWLDLDHLRGRAGYRFVTQAAEWHLRRRLSLHTIGGLRLEGESVEGDVTTAEFSVGEDRWQVQVRVVRGAPARLTCQSSRQRRPLRFQLVAIERA